MLDTLGVDIGGVIIDRIDDSADTSFFSGNYLKTAAMPGVFEALRRLVSERFKERVFLVSKCGFETQRKSCEWLGHQDFFKKTGVSPGHVEFCLKRRDKAAICEKLGVTHFIDDKLEVLSYLGTVPNKILFKPDEAEVKRYQYAYNQVKRVESWPEVEKLLLSPEIVATMNTARL